MTETTEAKTSLFVWEDPPAGGPGRRPAIDAILDEITPTLRAHPGRWAKVELSKKYSQGVKPLRVRYPGFSFRNILDKTTGLYGLYVRFDGSAGSPSPSAAPAPRSSARPATPTAGGPVTAPPPTRVAPLGRTVDGKVLACQDCDFETDKVAAIIKHTVSEHDRQATTVERTPVPAGA